MSQNQIDLVPTPFLHRLIDDNPSVKLESQDDLLWDFRTLLEAVRKDLENLLNCRHGLKNPIASHFKEVKRSILNYGLPDLTKYSGFSERDQQQLTRTLEEVIQMFEPRLKHVQVSCHSDDNAIGKTLNFTIEATLLIEPHPEEVFFDTQLDLSTGAYEISGAH